MRETIGWPRITRRGASVSLAGAAILLLTGCSGGTHDVTVATAEPHDIHVTAGGLGTVTAAVDLPVAFSAAGVKSAVLVDSVDVTLGAHVTVGQALMTIDPAPLTASLAALTVALQQAQAALAGIQARLNTAKPAQASALRVQVSAIAARVALNQQLVNIAGGQSPQITSPIAGAVAAINVSPGQLIAPGRPFVEIVDASTIQVKATLPISEQTLAVVGALATLSFADLPDVHLAATVIGVAPTATQNGLGFQVLVQGANTPGGQALPGLQAFVQLQATDHAAVAIPKMAISNIDQDPTVFVVQGDTTVHLQPIHVSAVDDTYADVTGGLKVGDKVVIVGYQTLTDGSKVRLTGTS